LSFVKQTRAWHDNRKKRVFRALLCKEARA